MITIIVEGGLVQRVTTDNPAEQGRAYRVIDLDVEGALEEDLSDVEWLDQHGGENVWEKAAIRGGIMEGPVCAVQETP